jgi:hypothetical protein
VLYQGCQVFISPPWVIALFTVLVWYISVTIALNFAACCLMDTFDLLEVGVVTMSLPACAI